MPREPGHISGSGSRIRGTVVAFTGFVGVFLLHGHIFSMTSHFLPTSYTKKHPFDNQASDIELSYFINRR